MIRMTEQEQNALTKMPGRLVRTLVYLYGIALTEQGHLETRTAWVAQDLGCGHQSAYRKLKELRGLGLITRTARSYEVYMDPETFENMPYTHQINRDAVKEVGRG